MANVTALQLVNRCRLLRRQPPVTSIATDEDTVTLNVINMAIENILGTRRWPFDLRHDGQLTTVAPFSITDAVVSTAGSTAAALVNTAVGIGNTNFAGDNVARVLVTGDTEYPNTPFRIDSHTNASGTNTSVNIVLGTTAPKSFNATGKLIYSEYVLPDTVRSVVRASYQEEEMQLEQVSPVTRFDEWIPNSGVDDGPPEVLAVGGYDIPTHVTGTATDPGLRAIIWPVPDDEYVINYSYYYRHPELTDATSTLSGVPPEVVSDVVEEATSLMGMAWDSDYAMSHFSDRAQAQSSAKHRAMSAGNPRRHTVNGWSSSKGTRTLFELGFPGKVIG